ncbi:Hsp70 family protein [Candidatus Methanomassiliicoccus intestinalis]|uniref:Hsp70 family protein n=1 Tax=Candidatus Methanomassiliicoccus intestinalis TaxID=1406512 RepID=UPI0037DD8760
MLIIWKIKKNLVLQAAHEAGISVKSLLNEPTAAAICFFKMNQDAVGKTIVVFDLGGGTLDVTVATCVLDDNNNPTYKVVVSKGKECLGGFQWDQELESELLLQCSKQSNRSEDEIKHAPTDYQMIRYRSEGYKIQLSSGPIDEQFVLPSTGESINFVLSVEDFEKKTEHRLLEALAVFDNALESAYCNEQDDIPKICSDDIYRIILVGGSSRMPQIKRGIIERHPEFNNKVLIRDPDLSISRGAAIWCKEYSENSLSEYLSNTFGVDAYRSEESEEIVCFNHIFLGQRIPCECMRGYITRHDDTDSFIQNIYQNTSPADTTYTELDDCTKIGDLSIQLPQKVPKHTPIKTTFRINVSGLISVTTECMGVTKSCMITLTPDLADHRNVDVIRGE